MVGRCIVCGVGLVHRLGLNRQNPENFWTQTLPGDFWTGTFGRAQSTITAPHSHHHSCRQHGARAQKEEIKEFVLTTCVGNHFGLIDVAELAAPVEKPAKAAATKAAKSPKAEKRKGNQLRHLDTSLF